MPTATRLLSATALLFLLPTVSHSGEMANVIVLEEPVNLLKQPRDSFRFKLSERPDAAEDPAETAEDIFKLDSEKDTFSSAAGRGDTSARKTAIVITTSAWNTVSSAPPPAAGRRKHGIQVCFCIASARTVVLKTTGCPLSRHRSWRARPGILSCSAPLTTKES